MLLVAAVTLPLLALSALAVWRAHEGERIRIGERLTAQARAMAFSIDREFDRAEALLHVLAAAPALARGDLAGFEAQMRSLSTAQFAGEPLSLTTSDGIQVINTAWPPGTRRPGAPDFGAARATPATGRAVISDLSSAPATGKPAIVVVVPAPGPGGSPSPTMH